MVLMDRGAWWAIVHGVSRFGYNLELNHYPPICSNKGERYQSKENSLRDYYVFTGNVAGSDV